ncbi:MAG: hypothetical protein LBR97_09615 [Dysgonamonadaceae bacterium]|jgi:hypothetical protein|nr:hypothetical protein [Dysgonamonadaceae bacterium]
MRLVIPIVIVSLLLISCTQSKEKDDALIVKAGNKTLIKSDLDENIPANLPYNDSVIAVEHYIRRWITDVLMYDIAEKNTNDMAQINRLVENYKKSLVIYHYQEQLINEKLSKNITEQDLYKYYENNKEKFRMDKYSAQGIFMNLADSLAFGDIIPFEYVKPVVREMLVNQQKIDFLKETEADIYQRALDKGVVKFYKE